MVLLRATLAPRPPPAASKKPSADPLINDRR